MDIKYPDPEIEQAWKEDREKMSHYILNKEEPPLPEMIVFDKHSKIRFQLNKEKYVIEGCWKENWMVKWSMYFEQMTGFDNEDDWVDSLKPKMKELNDAIKEQYKIDNGLEKK
jgi:hypothetical protein